MSTDQHTVAMHIPDVIAETARTAATEHEVYSLLNGCVRVWNRHLPVDGTIVWLRAEGQDVLTPVLTRVAHGGASTSAISEEHALVQRLVEQQSVVLGQADADPLVAFPERDSALVVATVTHADTLLGLVGFLAPMDSAHDLLPLLRVTADVLAPALAYAWVRRQQAEADDVGRVLYQFAAQLRPLSDATAISAALAQQALHVFDGDRAVAYHWDATHRQYTPVAGMTRIGVADTSDDPPLSPGDFPLLEVLIGNNDTLAITDLREQPRALSPFIDLHDLRGLVLVPVQMRSDEPQALLIVGYRAPLARFGSRMKAVAQGIARMVAVALSRTA